MRIFLISFMILVFLSVLAVGHGFGMDVSENLTVVSYGSDGHLVTEQKILTPGWMKAHLPVYGNGETAYSFGGVNTSSSPEISSEIRGTPLKDIVDQVGGMEKTGWVRLVSSDGESVDLPYAALYHTPPSLGTAVLAWNGSGSSWGTEKDCGYQLFFVSQDTVFTTDEMISLFPERYWGYSMGGEEAVPSASGLFLKNIDRVEVYDPILNGWDLILTGTLATVLSPDSFETDLPGSSYVSWKDTDGNIWSGYPLWNLVSLVDDENVPSDTVSVSDAFSNRRMTEGYNITITSRDGSSINLSADRIARNDRIIIADRINGDQMMQKYPDFPLRLTGSDLPDSEQIGGIVKIALHS